LELKTYYYLIRAYKTSKESANSNIASVKIPVQTATPATTEPKTIIPTSAETIIPWYKNWVYWLDIIGGAAVIALGIYLTYRITKRRSQKQAT